MKIKQSTLRSAAGADAAIAMNESGFLPGMVVPVVIGSPGAAFAGSAIIQSSVDGTTWGTATGAAAVTAGGTTIQSVTLNQYMRLNVTAYTSGSIQATFLGDIA